MVSTMGWIHQEVIPHHQAQHHHHRAILTTLRYDHRHVRQLVNVNDDWNHPRHHLNPIIMIGTTTPNQYWTVIYHHRRQHWSYGRREARYHFLHVHWMHGQQMCR
jgi:hypothetical protein